MSVDPSRLSVDPDEPQTWNRYAYARDNPLGFVDRNGKWSKWVHEDIIDSAFGSILSENDRQILKNASAWVDDVSQDPKESFKHGMRSPFQDPTEAIAEANAFINENLEQAVRNQIIAEETGHTGNDPGALSYFGDALHTVTDSTSPWHRDSAGTPLPWAGVGGDPFGAAWHGFSETLWGYVSEDEAKYEAGVQAQHLWARYQQMLEEARQKEKEEEERRKKCIYDGKEDCVN